MTQCTPACVEPEGSLITFLALFSSQDLQSVHPKWVDHRRIWPDVACSTHTVHASHDRARNIQLHSGFLHGRTKQQDQSINLIQSPASLHIVIMPDCAQCGAHDASRRCGKCRTTYYCNAECQRAGWPTHKTTCVEPAGEDNAGAALPTDEALELQCAKCGTDVGGQDDSTRVWCRRCRNAVYCSRECKEGDASTHADACEAVAKGITPPGLVACEHNRDAFLISCV